MQRRFGFKGKKVDGKLVIDNKDLMSMIIDKVFADGSELYVILENRPVSKRTLDQNAYYWSTVVPTVRECLLDEGFEIGKDQTHEFLRGKFLEVEIENTKEHGILPLYFSRSTTDLTTTEFSEYIDNINEWLVKNYGIEIPEAAKLIDSRDITIGDIKDWETERLSY